MQFSIFAKIAKFRIFLSYLLLLLRRKLKKLSFTRNVREYYVLLSFTAKMFAKLFQIISKIAKFFLLPRTFSPKKRILAKVCQNLNPFKNFHKNGPNVSDVDD